MKRFLKVVFAVFAAAMLIVNTIPQAQALAEAVKTSPVVTMVSDRFGHVNAVSNAVPEKMKISIIADCSNYNHVGNEWGKTFKVNGSEVKSGSSVTLKAGDKITVSAKVIEHDDGKSDIGSGSTSKTLKQSDIDNGFVISLNVSVTENGGRYKGNTAKWTIEYDFH